MKIEVYSAPEKVLRLKLRPAMDGDGVSLIAVDEHGEELHHPSILAIRSDGTVQRFEDVNESIGLQLDTHGRIKEVSKYA